MMTTSAPLILAFDTSAAHCAAALLSGDKLLAQAHEPMAKGQAERLMPLVAEVMAAGGVGLPDLDAIGVGVGPGNFTGIRISVSAARGLALALDIPAVGVSTLEALAHALPRPLCVIEDARRDAVYVQNFDATAAHAPLLLSPGDLAACIGARAITGSGVAVAQSMIAGLHVLPPALPLAEAIARIAAQRWHDPALARPAPLYLRSPDAAPARIGGPVMLPA